MEPPPEIPSDSSSASIPELAAQIRQIEQRVQTANAARTIGHVVTALAVVTSLALGIAGGYWAGRRAAKTSLDILALAAAAPAPQMERGLIPVELNQQTLATGSVVFSRPFARRPLVFICEAGHAGVFLVCKTDAISETGFKWAVGAGPVPRDYQSELAWLAIEP
jgi:hypothetical protein